MLNLDTRWSTSRPGRNIPRDGTLSSTLRMFWVAPPSADWWSKTSLRRQAVGFCTWLTSTYTLRYQVRFQVSPFEFCGGQSGTKKGFSHSTSVFPSVPAIPLKLHNRSAIQHSRSPPMNEHVSTPWRGVFEFYMSVAPMFLYGWHVSFAYFKIRFWLLLQNLTHDLLAVDQLPLLRARSCRKTP